MGEFTVETKFAFQTLTQSQLSLNVFQILLYPIENQDVAKAVTSNQVDNLKEDSKVYKYGFSIIPTENLDLLELN